MAETCEIDELTEIRAELEQLVALRFSGNWGHADERHYGWLSRREIELLEAPSQLDLFDGQLAG